MVLTYRTPFDSAGLLGFLAARATPGVESVTSGTYRRACDLGAEVGTLEASIDEQTSTLRLCLVVARGHSAAISSHIGRVAGQLRRVFDLEAEPGSIGAHLSRDPLLSPLVHAHPGTRVPGAWDGFELAVRAILGQQVSVRAATTLTGRVAAAWGRRLEGASAVDRLFPTAAQLADAPLEAVGVMPSRATTIRLLSRMVADGAIRFDPAADGATTLDALARLPGIGPWTVQYIAMRAFGDRDALPSGDLILRRAAGGCSARELERRSESWRPWRAYAVMLLWRAAARASLPGATSTGK